MRENNISSKRKPELLVAVLAGFLIFGCQNETQQPVQAEDTTESQSEPERLDREKTILFFGNSITAGYQLNPDDAFPAIIQTFLDSLGYSQYQTVNAGISGETSGDGASRIDWLLKQPVDVFVLELGGNDGLRGMELDETEENLRTILQKVRTAYPRAHLIVSGMEIPPNMGPAYTSQFRELFPGLAKEFDATLIPFLLEGVAGEPDLNLDDGIHPTEEGHEIVAATIWTYLQPLLEASSSDI